MGGKQVDLALKKVMLRASCPTGVSMLTLLTLMVFPLPFLKGSTSSACFSGSTTSSGSRYLEVISLRGDSFRLRVFEEEMMMSVICSSWVEGNSSSSSFLVGRVAVVSLRAGSTGKESRLGSSRVQNFREQNLAVGATFSAGCEYWSSKQAKKEVFSGEQWRRSESARWGVGAGSGSGRGRSAGMRRLLRSLRGKKSTGSLFLFILMRLRRVLGSLKRRWLSLRTARSHSTSESCLRDSLPCRTVSISSIQLQLFIGGVGCGGSLHFLHGVGVQPIAWEGLGTWQEDGA